MHRHRALALILAIPVTACQQPLQPRANLADPLFAATAASEYQALDLGRFLPTVVNSRGDVAGTVGIGRSQATTTRTARTSMLSCGRVGRCRTSARSRDKQRARR